MEELEGPVEGVGAVVEEALERAGEHLFEADDEGDVCSAVGEELPGEVEAGGAGRTVVVDVVDGDLGHSWIGRLVG